MRTLTHLVSIITILSVFSCNTNEKRMKQNLWPEGIVAPVAAIKPYQRTLHNDTVTDNYYWLNDYFKKGPDSSQVVEYLKAENAYLDSMMADTKPFQEKLFQEMKGRIKEKDESVPVFKNGYYYYTRTEEGRQYYKYCRKKASLDAAEEILLDVDEMAKPHSYYAAGGFNISDDNKLMAFAVDTVSRRQYSIHIKNLETGEILTDIIPGTSGGSVWAADNKTLFYTENNPETLLSEKIKRHRLGLPVSNDVVIYKEEDVSNYIGVARSKTGNFIFINSEGTLSSETRFISAATPEASFVVFQPRRKEVLYDVFDQGSYFYVRTNQDAKNFRLMKCAYNQTSASAWQEVIPHRTDVLLEDIDVFKNFLVVDERENGLTQLRIMSYADGKEHHIDFGEPTYNAGTSYNPEYNTDVVRYNYTSLTTPNSVYDYNMADKTRELKKQQEVLGGYNAKDYTAERLYATAKDGSKVPISLVYKNGFKKDGNSPLLLYAYGSYGNSMDASFSGNRLSLLNRGFAFAIAHIRGGQEMGRQWYEDGKMLKKKNTFTDFIDCGEFLVKEKYTSSQHLYAQGGSAGGLLMGAVSNMAPQLWHGVIAQVPFVDVVTTMMDASIPLTTNEYDEWGNPENKEAYDYMKSYSPYENVDAKEYPNLLVTTGLHDSQVQYFEPAKWVAKLRTVKKGNNVVLLETNMDYGHGGASGRFDYLKEIALEYAFLFKLEGISE